MINLDSTNTKDSDKDAYQKIINDAERSKERVEQLSTKKNALEYERDELIYQNQECSKQLAELNMNIEEMKNKIQNIINSNLSSTEGSSIGFEELGNKCKIVLTNFTGDNTSPITFFYKIIYNKITIIRSVEDFNMTFGRLKQDTKHQFDKGIDDFFFADEENKIYLDDLVVKNALFPIDNIKLKDYVPVLRVIDRIDCSVGCEKIDDFEGNVINNEEHHHENIQRTFCEKVWHMKYIILSSLFFTIFYVTFIASCINFREISGYRIFVQPFKDYQGSQFLKIKDVKSFLPSFKQEIARIFQYPSEESSSGISYDTAILGNFNKANKNVGHVRILQTRYLPNICFTKNYNFDNCKRNKRVDTGTYRISDQKWLYHLPQYSNKILGNLDEYKFGGYIEDISVTSPSDFYNRMNYLIKYNWINEGTRSIIVILNFYNINLDLYTVVKLLFENIGDKLQNKLEIETADATSKLDPYLIVSIIFALLVICIQTISLMKPRKSSLSTGINNRDDEEEVHRTCGQKTKICYQNMILWFKKTFNKPSFLETFTYINFLIFIISIIIRGEYYIKLNNLVIDTTKYNNIASLSEFYNHITNINCAVIILFFYSVLNYFSYFSRQFKIIRNAVLSYIYYLFFFFAAYSIFFTVCTNFCNYYMVGDFYFVYYKDVKFIFVKMLVSFYKGSFDNADFENGLQRHKIHVHKHPSQNWPFIIKYSETPYLSIVDHIGSLYFVLISFIFYFLVQFVVKVVYTGIFITCYKKAIDDVEKEES